MPLWGNYHQRNWLSPWNSDESIREEIFGRERFEEHAVSLARAQSLGTSSPRIKSLVLRLADNERVLLDAHRMIAGVVASGRSTTPAAEWLVNNSHVVEEQIRMIRTNLPPAFSNQLPKLAGGPFAGYPRVFAVAWAYVAHTDSRFDKELLEAFINAYQSVEPLTIGELWALPIMIQLVLVENLRRAAGRIITSRQQRKDAEELAARIAKKTLPLKTLLAEVVITDGFGNVKRAFISELVFRLSDGLDDASDAQAWMRDALAAFQLTPEQIVHHEHRSIGATNNTVRQIIHSLRVMPDIDWTKIFEKSSLVDRALNRYPLYRKMDFPTRNAYRDVIERVARRSPLTEVEIAECASALAGSAPVESKARDPGFYLIGGGQKEFHTEIKAAYRLRDVPALAARRGGLVGYLGAISVVVTALLALPILMLVGYNVSGVLLALLALTGLFPALDLAIALVNQAITHEFEPQIIPALELDDGIPDHARTLVAVPAMLSDEQTVRELINRIETHHLATQQRNIFYALVSDWNDSPQETNACDDALFELAQEAIAKLNHDHGSRISGAVRFFLIHRRRVWNPSEHCWMGWERKRGKLQELNRLLRGTTDTTFVLTDDERSELPRAIKYVITLDSDTRLPRDAARRLIGKMLHPLNQPVLSSDLQQVVDGYGILQPRVTPMLATEQEASQFQRLFSTSGGIDPYAGAISDVYQDLFGLGSFAGKGIYDVDAFEAATSGLFLDNEILSHDLLEGLFVRAGLASDVEVVEEFPSRYDVAKSRDHRWARGDWQLLPWILSKRSYKSGIEGLNALGQWKIIDNLRRSITPVATFIALVSSWFLPAQSAAAWTVFIAATMVLPAFLSIAPNVLRTGKQVKLFSHISALVGDASIAVKQSFFTIATLADRAVSMGDAISRTLYRLFVSRQHLLEWTTAAQAKSKAAGTIWTFYRRMSGGVALAVLTLAAVYVSGSEGILVALPVTAFWMLAPAIAHWASFSPAGFVRREISAANHAQLRLTGRRTWLYFETFVSSDDHFLPPDNFQEEPKPVVAHRTSPTNIGLYLLSTVSAYEFGWISMAEGADRLEQTLRTLGRLDRFRGHYFNWYNTTTLAVLEPRYISTVDSGNLAGHLIASANACRTWAAQLTDNPRAAEGLRDCLGALRSAIVNAEPWIEFELDDIERHLATVPVEQKSGEPAGVLHDDLVAIASLSSRLSERLEHESSNRSALIWSKALERTAKSHLEQSALDREGLNSLRRRLSAIADAADYISRSMEFSFLLDEERELLSIGYSVDSGNLDDSCYDLLASEARLASFFAIAKNDLPTRHWFRLGRTLLPVGNKSVLSSWSGSMFEYLMPELVTLTPRDSLLGASIRTAVSEHMRYGKQTNTPWGLSESAFNIRDLAFTYQYSSFGVPSLGLKRGLGESLVVAPYATGLASMVAPNEAAENYSRLADIGACGSFGFYEAIDFSPDRIPQSERFEIIKAYMSHHQGMTIVALANSLFGNVIAHHFHASPLVQAAELLLQERAPRLVSNAPERATLITLRSEQIEPSLVAVRRVSSPNITPLDCHVISNGKLSVFLTGTGAGYTQWKGLALTRWNGDHTLNNIGSFIYLKDVYLGTVWSAGSQPVAIKPQSYEAAFAEDRVRLSRTDGTLTTVVDVIVSPEDDATCRRISITNSGKKRRTIDVTTYDELVLGPMDADAVHPAFSKLFVETDYDVATGALIAWRRPRSPHEKKIWTALVVTGDGTDGTSEFETDRSRFIGRARSLAAPIAVVGGQPLSNSTGAVLDPIFSIRRRVNVAPGATVRLSVWLAAADSREALATLIEKYSDKSAFVRTATMAWTVGRVELRHLGIEAAEALLFQQLSAVLWSSSRLLRAPERVLQQGALGYDKLWSAGISGDLPIVLVQIGELADIGLVRQCLHAFEYWRRKGIEADLVIVNEHTASYQQDLQHALEALCQSVSSRHRLERDNSKGSVHLIQADRMQPGPRAALVAAAIIVFAARRGALAEQLDRLSGNIPGKMPPPRRLAAPDIIAGAAAESELEFFNGFGGFQNDGKEYVTVLVGGKTTPAPWINVISNPEFGFQVAADGGGYTWSVNSRERQITPWSNDPVINRPGEVFYVRDEDSGDVWCPTAAPIRDHAAPYRITHGQGYTTFEHASHGIELILKQFVAPEDPIKISVLTLRNISGRPRRLTVTSYVEWLLGSTRQSAISKLTTSYDGQRSAIFARNAWHPFFADRVAFSHLRGDIAAWTADRSNFIGLSGTLDNPAGLANGGKIQALAGTGYDPCGVLQTPIDLPSGSEAEVVSLLGDAAGREAANHLLGKYAHVDATKLLDDVKRQWDDLLNSVQVKTPDRSLDLLINRWLPYQTLTSRLWARGGLYQAGGAYGFRDQLQDVMAFAATRPDITRTHILRAASRQFPEGDVQHWWLFPSGHGVRTRIADSCLWLPYVVAHYVRTSGDANILNESVPFIDGPHLQPHEHELYFSPVVSSESADIFEHCARALEKTLATGPHGLALFGGGDWNDGMNRVGIEGRGESVWLSWFLIRCLDDCIPLAKSRGEQVRADTWRLRRDSLRKAIESEAWDGAWYRRGYFDDGTPFGSALSQECQIDSIAQSWSVLSEAGDPVRSRKAMASVKERLIDEEANLALLFAPPFDKTELEPGYIKGYPPGIRENGGQYTHAAAWTAIALAEMGDGDGAAKLLSLINPVNLSATTAKARRYRLEPYVLAADVYSIGPNKGRGGWSWYTGSAGWYYRAAVEFVLGVQKQGDHLVLSPTIPQNWPGFEVNCRFDGVEYHIIVRNPEGVQKGLVAAMLGQKPLLVVNDDTAIIPTKGLTGKVNIEITMGLMRQAAVAE